MVRARRGKLAVGRIWLIPGVACMMDDLASDVNFHSRVGWNSFFEGFRKITFII